MNKQGSVNSAWEVETVAVAGGKGALQYWVVLGSDTHLRLVAIFSADIIGLERSEIED